MHLFCFLFKLQRWLNFGVVWCPHEQLLVETPCVPHFVMSTHILLHVWRMIALLNQLLLVLYVCVCKFKMSDMVNGVKANEKMIYKHTAPKKEKSIYKNILSVWKENWVLWYAIKLYLSLHNNTIYRNVFGSDCHIIAADNSYYLFCRYGWWWCKTDIFYSLDFQLFHTGFKFFYSRNYDSVQRNVVKMFKAKWSQSSLWQFTTSETSEISCAWNMFLFLLVDD